MLKLKHRVTTPLVAALLALVMVGGGAIACSQAESEEAPAGPVATPLSLEGNPATRPGAGTGSSPSEPAVTSAPSSGSAAIAIAAATATAPTPTVPPAATADAAGRGSAGPVDSASPVPVASPTQAVAAKPVSLPSLVPEGETLIQLIDPLDEPEYYCVDVRGFGSGAQLDSPLQAHTCKPGGADELFLIDHPAEGQLSMPAYDLCLEGDGDVVYVRTCSDAAAQRFQVVPDGTVRTGDGQQCLATAPGEGEEAGGVSHLRRDLLLVDCTEGQRHLSRWILPGSNPSAVAPYSTQLMYDALDAAIGGDPWGVARLGDKGDPSYIPVLVEFMRFPWWHIDREVEEAIFNSLDRIVHQNPGIADVDTDSAVDEWARWVVWLGNHPEVWPPPGFAGWKGRLYSELVDPEMGALLYDGMRANIRVEEIVWGGVAKDGIPDLTDAPVVDGVDADYLDPNDRVFGVSFNGEHRAYPHRIINAHEMANDVVGGVPFALAY